MDPRGLHHLLYQWALLLSDCPTFFYHPRDPPRRLRVELRQDLEHPPGQHLVQGTQCSVLLKKMCPSSVVSAHLLNALPTQILYDLRVSHQSQVTRRGFSYQVILFSSTTIPRETFHCFKRFTIIWKEGPDEGLFEKYPASPPLEIHNSTAPPSAPGNHIEAGVINTSNWEEEIALVRNQGLEVDDDMEQAPNNVPLVYTPDSGTLFEGHIWGWDVIDCWDMVSQNKNDCSFKNV